ncbi:MAG: hypothetical protein KY410_07895 [Proteobacteria bacterium]|nr:hypothetical protein [Pseudomonadota bacterium]
MHRRMKAGGIGAQWQKGREGWIELPNGVHVRKGSKRHGEVVKALAREQRDTGNEFNVVPGPGHV